VLWAIDGLEYFHEALFGVGDEFAVRGGRQWGLFFLGVSGCQVFLEVFCYAIHTVNIISCINIITLFYDCR